jgi:Domain of unknown function (DUF4389)
MAYRSPMDEQHPVRLLVEDDYRRNRLTVLFRLLLAIPHYIWFVLWSILVLIVAVLNWFATLIMGRPPSGFHRFLCAYVRYSVHLSAYLYLVGNPYPGFLGEAGEYPIDVVLPEEPQAQRRWTVLLRIVLAIPAAAIGSALGGGFGVPVGFFFTHGGSHRSRSGEEGGFSGGGVLTGICALLGWFASLVTGRMPSGLRDAGAYGIGYSAQVRAYTLLLTDRYPASDPTTMLDSVPRPSAHPAHLVGEAHDLRRSRLTVFFRLPLFIPHYIWLYLWGYAAAVVAFLNWFATLFMGRPPRPFHRFLSAYVRYQFHVFAFLTVAANPFPGFTGKAGSYPLDLALPTEPQRQNRWKTAFRIILVIPAWAVSIGLLFALVVAAICTWFVALVRGSAPWGLRNLMAYALRYFGQAGAYLYLITDAYPHASPLEGEDALPA